MPKNKNNVTWWQVNNLIPLIASAITITVSYGVLFTKIAVLENKVDNLIAINQETLRKYSSVETRYGELSLKVRELEVKVNSTR